MLFYTAGQQYVFLLMAATGLVMGLWSDLCLSIECLIGGGRISRILTDLICTLGITILLFFAMLFSTRLDFRLYSVGAAGLGAVAAVLQIKHGGLFHVVPPYRPSEDHWI